MAERPILFSGPMVRAILAGTKTQTRRVITPQPDRVWGSGVRHGETRFSAHVRYATGTPDVWVPCPYGDGDAGDRLWVRETWNAVNTRGAFWDELNADERAGWRWLPLYKASETAGEWGHYEGPYRPSIHMPRQFSRITLEVLSVRVERVQDISEADAQAEGVIHDPDPITGQGAAWWVDRPDGAQQGYVTAREAYSALWDKLNEARGYGWKVNPWVWVVEFKAVQP